MSNEHGESANMVKLILKTTLWLSIITIVEIIAAVLLTDLFARNNMLIVLNSFYIIMSLAKAFFIVSVFMHLKFEVKFLAITILIPMTFLLFAVVALLAEGNSWLQMRNY
jgi:cytochrome c oxidase subunit IV